MLWQLTQPAHRTGKIGVSNSPANTTTTCPRCSLDTRTCANSILHPDPLKSPSNLFKAGHQKASEDINIHLTLIKRPWRLSNPALGWQKGKLRARGLCAFSKAASLQGFAQLPLNLCLKKTSHNSEHKPHRSCEPQNMTYLFREFRHLPSTPKCIHRCQVGKTSFQQYSHCWMHIFTQRTAGGTASLSVSTPLPISASPLATSMYTHIFKLHSIIKDDKKKSSRTILHFMLK